MNCRTNSNDKIQLLKEMVEFYKNEREDCIRVEKYYEMIIEIQDEILPRNHPEVIKIKKEFQSFTEKRNLLLDFL